MGVKRVDRALGGPVGSSDGDAHEVSLKTLSLFKGVRS